MPTPWLTALPETEDQFLTWILDRARASRWRTIHVRPGRTGAGEWRTPVQGDGVGFPDLVIVRDRIVYAEVKSERGTLSTEQAEWRERIIFAGGEWHLWRPRHRDLITEVLR